MKISSQQKRRNLSEFLRWGLMCNILHVIFWIDVNIFIVVRCNNILATVSSGLLLVFFVYLGIEMIQSGKSFLKFDCWSNKAFKRYKVVIQIMMSLFFTPINPRSIRSFLKSVMRWILNIKSNSISYSWYVYK